MGWEGPWGALGVNPGGEEPHKWERVLKELHRATRAFPFFT